MQNLTYIVLPAGRKVPRERGFMEVRVGATTRTISLVTLTVNLSRESKGSWRTSWRSCIFPDRKGGGKGALLSPLIVHDKEKKERKLL